MQVGTVWRTARRVLYLLFAVYVAVVAGLFLAQRRFIYHPEPLASVPPGLLAAGEELVTFPSSDGTRISGLFVKPPAPDAGLVLVLHGNAGNAVTWRGIVSPFVRHGFGAFVLDPRGFGLSEGSPDEEGWHRDADAVVAWLEAQGIPAHRLVILGVSVGSGLAVPLAGRQPVRGLILQSAFSSLVETASTHFPWVPCALLLRDRYDNLEAAPNVRCPVLILHGAEDVLVPPSHAERLAAAFSAPCTLRIAPHCGHDDLSTWRGYRAALMDFLDGLARPRAPESSAPR